MIPYIYGSIIRSMKLIGHITFRTASCCCASFTHGDARIGKLKPVQNLKGQDSFTKPSLWLRGLLRCQYNFPHIVHDATLPRMVVCPLCAHEKL